MTTIELQGFKEMQSVMVELPAAAQGRVYKRAVHAGARPIIHASRGNINNRTGKLSRSIGVKSFKRRDNKGAVAVIGPRTDGNYQGNHGPVVEAGRKWHGEIRPKTKKALAFDGKVFSRLPGGPSRPFPFLRPGFEAGARRAVEIIQTETLAGIEREAERLARGAR